MSLSHQSNGRFNVSMHQRPAQHQDRRVLDVRSGRRPPHLHHRAPTQVNGLPVSYTFANGVPRILTQFASPILHDRPAQSGPRALRTGPVAA